MKKTLDDLFFEGNTIKARRFKDFWCFGDSDHGEEVELTPSRTCELSANGPLYAGTYQGYVFVDNHGHEIILCGLRSWCDSERSVYGNCVGEEGYQFLE